MPKSVCPAASGGAQDAISISVPDQQGQPSLPVSARLNQARVLIGSQPGQAAGLYSQLDRWELNTKACHPSQVPLSHINNVIRLGPRRPQILQTV